MCARDNLGSLQHRLHSHSPPYTAGTGVGCFVISVCPSPTPRLQSVAFYDGLLFFFYLHTIIFTQNIVVDIVYTGCRTPYSHTQFNVWVRTDVHTFLNLPLNNLFSYRC
jgi:hypothetical protein